MHSFVYSFSCHTNCLLIASNLATIKALFYLPSMFHAPGLQFVEKAPKEVVDTVRQQATDAAEKLRALESRLEQLRAMMQTV